MADNTLVPGIVYVPYHSPRLIAYSEDNGQGITECVNFCTRWECQRWKDDQPIAPEIVVNANGFRVCSACGCSYGHR